MKIEITYPVEGFTRYAYTVIRPTENGAYKYAAGTVTQSKAEELAERFHGVVVKTDDIKGVWDYEKNYKRWYIIPVYNLKEFV